MKENGTKRVEQIILSEWAQANIAGLLKMNAPDAVVELGVKDDEPQAIKQKS